MRMNPGSKSTGIRAQAAPAALQRRLSCRASCAAVVALLAAASVARASHIVEFQIKSSKLIELIEHRLLEEEVCATSPFELPFQNGQFVLDHLAFPGPIQMQRTGTQIQFVVPVEIYTKTLDCIQDPGCGAHEYTPATPLSPNLVLDLNASVDENNKLNLCVEFDSLRMGATVIDLASLDPNLSATLGGLLSPKCSKIDVMKSLKKLLRSDRTIKKVGVTANADFGRVAVRIELDDPANPSAAADSSWSSFNTGQISPSGSGMEWSIFMNQTLLKQALASRFATSIGDQEDIEILQGPSAKYTAFGSSGARVELTMELEVDAGCPFNNIGIDPAIVTLDLSATSAKPNIIQSHGLLYTDVIDADVVACAFSFGPFGALVLPVFAVVASNEGPDEGDFPDECNQISDEEFACDQPVTLPVIRLSKFGNASWATSAILTLNKLYGHDGGISMGGPCTVNIGIPTPPKELLQIGDGGFSYGVQGGCSSLHLGWSGGLSISGDGAMCQVYVIDDPMGVYDVDWNPIAHALGGNWIGDFRYVGLTFPKPGGNYDGYVANPYPCRLVIRSSCGARCVEIPGPDPESINELAAAAELVEAKANCLKPFWFSLKYMEMLWLVDPPPFDMPVSVRFEDPFMYTHDVTSHVSDLAISIADPVATEDVDGGQVAFNAVKMNVSANVMVHVGAAAPAPYRGASGPAGVAFPGGAPGIVGVGAANGKSKAAGRENGEWIEMKIEQPLVVDLSGVLADGSLAELKTSSALRQTVQIPPDQLPEGIAELSIALEIPLEGASLNGVAEPYELEYAPRPEPLDQACGSGACGVGGAGAVPFMAFGWFAVRTRRTSRRRANCRKACRP